MKIDPEFKSLIPPLAPDEYAQLEANIIAEGCRDPLVVWSGTLIDGHNRFEICERHGIEFATVEKDFESREAVMLWMEENQVGRRNLNDDQRAVIGDSIRERRSKAAVKARNPSGVNQHTIALSDTLTDKATAPKTDTRAAVAKEMNLPERKLRAAQEVRKKAPELAEKVRNGKMSLLEAKKAARREEIASARQEIAKAADSIPKSDRFQVVRCDLSEYSPPSPVDAIITDPPYPREFLPLWSVLAEKANGWLKPGGIVVAMSGQAYLDEVYRRMAEHLEYYWTACYHTPGQPTPLRQVNVNTTWKPLLIFCRKGERFKGKIFGDFMASEKNEKDFHKWGQSVSGMDAILERFALPGQSVLDPFCGAGTTGVSAVRRGCLFYGCEIEEENAKISMARIAEVIQ